jgi:hypothetical protein
MEAMCFNFSDTIGDQRTNIYAFLENIKDKFDDILKGIINFHGGDEKYVGHLLQPPEQRLKPYMTDVEKKAWSNVNEGETLIFGHTHRPFVSTDHRIVNTGSWVTDAQIHNTFVELNGDRPRIWNFKDKDTVRDITESLTFPIST